MLAEVTQPLQGHGVVEAADADVERGGTGRPRAASAVFARRAHEEQPNSIYQLDVPEVSEALPITHDLFGSHPLHHPFMNLNILSCQTPRSHIFVTLHFTENNS